eukprot:5467440-Pyramimonas_sp.AAC.2
MAETCAAGTIVGYCAAFQRPRRACPGNEPRRRTWRGLALAVRRLCQRFADRQSTTVRCREQR